MGQIRWKSLDVLKGLSCIAVVLIHFNFEGDIGLYVKTFCRFAVPTFLIISGFFFLSGDRMDDAKVVSKIRHIINLVMGSAVFYAVFLIVVNKFSNSSWDWLAFVAERADAGRIVKLFFTNDPLVYSHLWYLLALIYCYVFALILFNKNNAFLFVNILAPVLLIIYSCLQEFGAALGISSTVPIPGSDLVLSLYNLFVFRALPFFLLGIIIRRYYTQISHIPLNMPIAILIFLMGGCLAIYERTIFRESQFYIGTYIMVAVMVITAMKKPESEIKILGYIGRELSLYVYILHIAVGRVMDIVVRKIGFYETVFYTWGRAFIILIMSLLLAKAIIMIKKLCEKRKRKKQLS